uniref:DOMON domain-containing protein n=1 Tax=Panagrolaimus superbus TaxID=310955 RepID=A0A914YYN8_9BILA
MHLFLITLLIAFLQAFLAQSQCNFQSDRYNLSWSADNYRNINYNLTYFNFPNNANYWVALGYSQPNLILVDSINGQIEIGTANIVNNQPRKTINSNILVQKSAFLSNGNLHAQFSIPLDALKLSSNDASGCLQWQFYTNATQNGTQYNGMPQTQRICNIENCMQQQPNQMMFNDPSFSGTTKDPNGYYEYLKNLYQQQLQQGSIDNNQYPRQTTYGGNNNNYNQYQGMQNNNNYQSNQNMQYDQTSNQYQTGAQNYNTQTTSNTYPVQSSACNNCNQQIQPQNAGCTSCNQQQTAQYQQTSQTTNCNSCNQQTVQQSLPISGCSTCNQQPSQNQQFQSSNSNCNSCNQQNQGSQFQQSQQQFQTTSQYGNNNQGGSNAYGNNVQYNPQYQSSSQYGNNQGSQFQGSIPSPGTGFVYDSPQTNSNSDFVVENPNYIFLNPGLTQEFRDSVNRPNNQNGLFRDQSGNVISTTTQAPLLSNDEQNRQNYQRIQSNPPTTVSPSLYTNNIYGYDYRSNQNQPFTVNGNNQQYQPPPYRRFEAPSNSPFKRRKRQAASGSLAGTAYEGQDRPFLRTNNVFFDPSVQRNPSQTTYNSNTNSVYRNPSTNYNGNTNPYNNPNSNNNNNYNNNNNNNNQYNYQNVQRDQQPNNASIYWPYRQQVVSADDVVNPNSPNYTQVLQQNDAAERNFENQNCSGQDPYWCQDYVNNFMLWQNQYDGQSQQPSQVF